ncbi:MAG: hypothetical protein WCG45_03795, partial [bacterium]
MQSEILDYKEKEVFELVSKIDDVFSFFKEELSNGITKDARKLCLNNLLSYTKELMSELGGKEDLLETEDRLRKTIKERNEEISNLKSQNTKNLDNKNIGLLLEKNKNFIIK